MRSRTLSRISASGSGPPETGGPCAGCDLLSTMMHLLGSSFQPTHQFTPQGARCKPGKQGVFLRDHGDAGAGGDPHPATTPTPSRLAPNAPLRAVVTAHAGLPMAGSAQGPSRPAPAPALDRAGYRHRAQVVISDRLGCGRHVVDAIAEKGGREVLVSVKWQQVAGTAEQKVPFEAICLLDAVERGPYEKAYLVLGGEGWKLRQFYVGPNSSNHSSSRFPRF